MDKPEQPNTELMIVKTIQGLMTCVSNELGKLNELTPPEATERKVWIGQMLEDTDLTEKTTLYELQKTFE